MKYKILSMSAGALLALSLSNAAHAVVYPVHGATGRGLTTVTVDADPSTLNIIDPFVISSLSDVVIDLSSVASTKLLRPGVLINIPAITFANPAFGGYSFVGTAGAGVSGSFSHVLPGSYFLTFTSAAASTGGVFSGTVQITAVPEPGPMGMVLAGLGVLGMTVHRKFKQPPGVAGIALLPQSENPS
jgi:hypothetical protein